MCKPDDEHGAMMLTLISISLDTKMLIDYHDLDMAIPLFFASIYWPAHIFTLVYCVQVLAQVHSNASVISHTCIPEYSE